MEGIYMTKGTLFTRPYTFNEDDCGYWKDIMKM